MNGVLWKWTNYYNGWQPRWFVLKDGILSYFRSEEEVNSGSKGSINLSVCDVNVNTYDPSRFEIIIPGEQKYFLKASNTQERQRWIVSLGTGKACHTEPEFQLKERVGDYNLPLKEISFKESELRVYLELMNQQVTSIKSQLHEDTCPDLVIINDLTATLNAACDTFIESLKDLVAIAVTSGTTTVPDSPPTHIGSPVFSLPIHGSMGYNRQMSGSRPSNGSLLADLYTDRSSSIDQLSLEPATSVIRSRRETNFLIEMAHSFVDWCHQVSAGESIPTIKYINSFSSLVRFLDYFEIQPIVSLKADIRTLIKKLSLKYGSDEKKYCKLDNILVRSDGPVDSVTVVLGSLHRTLVFVEHFLSALSTWLAISFTDIYATHDHQLKQMIIDAFDSTMKHKLTWFDRGQFTIITHALPTLTRFLVHALCMHDDPALTLHTLLTCQQHTLQQLMVDLARYTRSIAIVNQSLSSSFMMANIEL